MVLWGRPVYGKDLALYWAWQVITHIKMGGVPGDHNLQMVFIANMIGVDVSKLATKEYQFILKPVSEVITRYMISLMEPEPEIVPARFQPMDWAWHMKERCPVLILGWDKDYCKFLMPMKARKDKHYAISYWVGDGPADAPAQGGQIYCLFVELDEEPDYLIPLHLEIKTKYDDQEHWPGWEKPHGMDVRF